ncbi:DNA alkylation repair protein [Cedecea neteri]|uniref:DNA alkylation repair protein n=1 Tax=Cedecea neteri TaxID=158822 RepID=UPI0004F77648|nr:DNA alkylation repair protein [Cedecea neteri]AIR67095.1 DNA alkylation repair protein [Cedecea neteri]
MSESVENQNAFKHAFNHALLQDIASLIARHYPAFNAEAFLNKAEHLDKLEMKARVQVIRDALAAELPQDYPAALAVVVSVLKENKLRGFAVWPFAEFIQVYGLNHPELSLEALKVVTVCFTAEWAVRPFIKQDPDATMRFLLQCAQDESVDIRRWASEGTRPRVPWGEKLHLFIKDPAGTRAILDALKFDPELYVRKSVANHLNDITKDHPDYVIQLLQNWQQQAKQSGAEDVKKVTWITRHSLRTLIKNGHPDALSLIGVQHGADVALDAFSLKQKAIVLGENLEFKVSLRSTSDASQNIVVDYVIHFMKANGSPAPKVFKLRAFELPAGGAVTIEKKHAMKKITTRQYYPGVQRIEIQVNGKVLGGDEWELDL